MKVMRENGMEELEIRNPSRAGDFRASKGVSGAAVRGAEVFACRKPAVFNASSPI
jgi:hypothetical protein